MEIISLSNKEEHIQYILTELNSNLKTLILTNKMFPIVDFNLLTNTQDWLFMEIIDKFDLYYSVDLFKFYDCLVISGFLLDFFEIAFLKKFCKLNNKIVYFLLNEDESLEI